MICEGGVHNGVFGFCPCSEVASDFLLISTQTGVLRRFAKKFADEEVASLHILRHEEAPRALLRSRHANSFEILNTHTGERSQPVLLPPQTITSPPPHLMILTNDNQVCVAGDMNAYWFKNGALVQTETLADGPSLLLGSLQYGQYVWFVWRSIRPSSNQWIWKGPSAPSVFKWWDGQITTTATTTTVPPPPPHGAMQVKFLDRNSVAVVSKSDFSIELWSVDSNPMDYTHLRSVHSAFGLCYFDAVWSRSRFEIVYGAFYTDISVRNAYVFQVKDNLAFLSSCMTSQGQLVLLLSNATMLVLPIVAHPPPSAADSPSSCGLLSAKTAILAHIAEVTEKASENEALFAASTEVVHSLERHLLGQDDEFVWPFAPVTKETKRIRTMCDSAHVQMKNAWFHGPTNVVVVFGQCHAESMIGHISLVPREESEFSSQGGSRFCNTTKDGEKEEVVDWVTWTTLTCSGKRMSVTLDGLLDFCRVGFSITFRLEYLLSQTWISLLTGMPANEDDLPLLFRKTHHVPLVVFPANERRRIFGPSAGHVQAMLTQLKSQHPLVEVDFTSVLPLVREVSRNLNIRAFDGHTDLIMAKVLQFVKETNKYINSDNRGSRD